MDLLADHNLPFAAALAVMVVLALLQVLGLGDALGHPDVDVDVDVQVPDGGAMDGLASLLGIGRLPFLILLGLFLLLFAGVGLSIQQLAASLTGAPLAPLLAVVITGIACLPLTGAIARPLARLLPGDETTAVGLDALLGRRARITDGTARAGSPARARVHDFHGQMHHVMVEPHDPGGELCSGDEVLLLRREGEAFFAMTLENRALSPD